MTRISRATKSERGFSLIEILIVIALIALIYAVAIPGLESAFRAGAESFVRRLAGTLREARDRALLTNKLIRLRIDMEKQQYWLEEAPGNYLAPKAASGERLSEREREEAEKREADSFRLVKEITKEKQSVPKGVRIVAVIVPRSKSPLTEGMIDVFFFNNGSADAAILHFEDEEKNKQSLQLHPVTGQSKIVQGFIGGEMR